MSNNKEQEDARVYLLNLNYTQTRWNHLSVDDLNRLIGTLEVLGISHNKMDSMNIKSKRIWCHKQTIQFVRQHYKEPDDEPTEEEEPNPKRKSSDKQQSDKNDDPISDSQTPKTPTPSASKPKKANKNKRITTEQEEAKDTITSPPPKKKAKQGGKAARSVAPQLVGAQNSVPAGAIPAIVPPAQVPLADRSVMSLARKREQDKKAQQKKRDISKILQVATNLSENG
jgi:hypothetical protein